MFATFASEATICVGLAVMTPRAVPFSTTVGGVGRSVPLILISPAVKSALALTIRGSAWAGFELRSSATLASAAERAQRQRLDLIVIRARELSKLSPDARCRFIAHPP